MDNQIKAAYITAIPASIIALAAVCIAFNQQRLDIKRAQRELFEKFNMRFDKLNEYLNAIYRGDTLPAEKTREGVVQDYLNLCSEEYLANQEGLVSKRVWNSWNKGMQFYLQYECIREVFREQKRLASDSYYGLLDKMDYLSNPGK